MITDEELLSICEAEIQAASGYVHGELASERAEALDRYLGENYGDEVEGRSKVHSRDVMETVEWILPSLCRMFCDQDNLVIFEPVGPEDEEQAEQETDVCNHIYWKQNRGFYNTYTFLKDTLLSKTGILKCWWEENTEEQREEYSGLDDIQLGELLADDSVEREIIEYEETEEGHHVVLKTKGTGGKIHIEPTPPEEFGVERAARSPYAKDCNFVYHRCKKTYSELIEAGYDAKLLDSLPSDDDVDTEERLARRNLSDEEEGLEYANHPSMRTFWITECYIKIDRNGDNIAEICKVTMAAGSVSGSGARLLDVEEVDRIPFSTATPNVITHKFYGLSIADLVMDLQEIKTVITRQILDNAYRANAGERALNIDYVELDDVLTPRPDKIVRVKGDQPASAMYSPVPHTPMPQEVFGMLEYLDEMRKQRTGVGDEVAGLDKTSLGQVNTGVFALAYDSARMKIELIARIIAEIGFRPLFKDIHELMQKNSQGELTVRLRGNWQRVNPGSWRERADTSAAVGVGQVSRERKLMALEAIMQKQAEVAEAGGMGTLLNPMNMYQSLKDWTDSWGLEPRMYFMDPKEAPPKPQGPSAEEQMMMAQMQALQIDAQSKVEKNKVDMAKAQLEAQIKEREFAFREREAAAKYQLEQLKADQAQIRERIETEGKVADMRMSKEKQDIDVRVKAMEQHLDHVKAERDREVDIYKVQLDALIKTMQAHGVTQNPEEQEAEQLQAEAEKAHTNEVMSAIAQSVAMLTEKLHEMDARASQPRKIIRDAQGLVTQIGDQIVQRDESGRMIQIG